MACFENIAPRRMCAAGQLQPAASADLRHTFASGLYFKTKPSMCDLIPITLQLRGRHFASGSISCTNYERRGFRCRTKVTHPDHEQAETVDVGAAPQSGGAIWSQKAETGAGDVRLLRALRLEQSAQRKA